MSERDLGTYQMLWDCTSCGTPKLLGLTHRHCPHCGAPQDPTARYFPTDAEAVAVEDHVFSGADWRCEACDTPNSNRADFCMACGSPRDKSKQVEVRQAQTEGLQGFSADSAEAARAELKRAKVPPEVLAQLAQAPSQGSSWVKWLIGLVVLGIAGGLIFTFWTQEAGVEVTGHTWERNIDVEVFRPSQEQAWKESVPLGAYNVSCFREQRSTRQVPDGQDCREVREDQGDGTFRKVEKCSTRYRSEPVYDTRCRYTIDTWKHARTLTARGQSLNPPPSWPAVKLSREGQCLGCEREGRRSEILTTLFKDLKEPNQYTCELPAGRWNALQVGDRFTGQVGVLSGKLSCDQLTPLK
ncbi:MAG: hypothetical protein ACKO6N_19740 [Myxococcota bacterium]